jgi:hypothetical protein
MTCKKARELLRNYLGDYDTNSVIELKIIWAKQTAGSLSNQPESYIEDLYTEVEDLARTFGDSPARGTAPTTMKRTWGEAAQSGLGAVSRRAASVTRDWKEKRAEAAVRKIAPGADDSPQPVNPPADI